MKQVVHNEIGNPAEVLHLEDIPQVKLEAGDVRVNVLATPIHPSNLLQISGQYGVAPTLPAIPGAEGVGEVVEVGANVSHLSVGQTVMLPGGNGTWKQEITGPAAGFIPLPAGADIQQLSMLTVNPITALLLLTTFADLKEGDWVLQSAANSAVGGYLVQLAKKRGIKTVNVVRRKSAADEVRALGGDVVLIDGPDLNAQIKEATGDAQIMLAIDAVAGDTFPRLVDALSYGGTVVSYGALSMEGPVLSSIAVIFNDIRVRGFWLAQWFNVASPEEKQAAFGEIIQLVASGAIRTNIDATFTLDQITEAVTYAAKEGRNGKVLLTPNAA